jgi:uncharacterized protein YjaG (DUF416 family)
MNDLEKLQGIMKNINQYAGYGVFPMSAKDFYAVLEILQNILAKEGKKDG